MKKASILGRCYGSIRKVVIVMFWKNLTLKLRHYIQTLLEILVPTLLFAATLAIYLEGGADFTPSFRPASYNEPEYPLVQYCIKDDQDRNNVTKIMYTSCPSTARCSFNQTSVLVDEIFKKIENVSPIIQNLCTEWPGWQEWYRAYYAEHNSDDTRSCSVHESSFKTRRGSDDEVPRDAMTPRRDSDDGTSLEIRSSGDEMSTDEVSLRHNVDRALLITRFRQFYALQWMSFCLKKKNWFMTLNLVLIPTVMTLVFPIGMKFVGNRNNNMELMS